MQNLAKHVRAFHGEGSTKFHAWLMDMDQLAITVDSERMCVLSTLTLGGLAGSFVSRFLKENPNTQWCTLRKKLRERFSDSSDLALAQEQCRRMRQRKDESVQNFAERLRTAASDAFDNLTNLDTQRTLVEIFQKGVQSDHLSRYLIRKKYPTLDQAVECAVDEARADRCFQLCRESAAPAEPMDVDAVRADDRLDKLQNDLDRLTKQMDKLTRRPQYPSSRPPPRHQSLPPRQNSAPFRHQSAPPTRFRNAPCQPPPAQSRPPTNPQRPPPGAYRTHVTATVPPPPPPPVFQQYQGPAPYVPNGPYSPPADPCSANGPVPVPLPAYQWTSDGRPICAACGHVGHRHRQCRMSREN